MYTVLQSSRYAGVSTSTIRNWTKAYGQFLSPSANPPPGQARQFTEDDLRVFATIAVMKAQLVETGDVIAALADGQRLEPVTPPHVDTPPDDDPGPRAEAAITIYKDLVTQLENRADKLADRLIEAEARAAAAERELSILKELYEASNTPTPLDRPPTFWEWVTGRRHK